MTPTDTTDLWREALEVMGYEVFILGGEELARIGPKTYVSYSDWNLFGLAVEWIEARGGRIRMRSPSEDEFWVISVRISEEDDKDKWHCARTLPEAAARWIVEHGEKIKEGADEKN